MNENIFDLIRKEFSTFEINDLESGYSLEIINPFCENNIVLYYDDSIDEYTLYFTYQHWHLNNEKDVIKYIKDIINGEIFSIEFFKDDERHFGSSISKEELENLSYDSLASMFYGVDVLKELVNCFKIRGFNKEDNYDAKFIMEENGKINIELERKI